VTILIFITTHVGLPLTDARNRRIGKKVDGILVQSFVYRNKLQPVLELDSNGNTVARFVYTTKDNVPE